MVKCEKCVHMLKKATTYESLEKPKSGLKILYKATEQIKEMWEIDYFKFCEITKEEIEQPRKEIECKNYDEAYGVYTAWFPTDKANVYRRFSKKDVGEGRQELGYQV